MSDFMDIVKQKIKEKQPKEKEVSAKDVAKEFLSAVESKDEEAMETSLKAFVSLCK